MVDGKTNNNASAGRKYQKMVIKRHRSLWEYGLYFEDKIWWQLTRNEEDLDVYKERNAYKREILRAKY